MKAVFLDALTMGENFEFKNWPKEIELINYPTTSEGELLEKAHEAQILITNKVKIQKSHFKELKNLKLICIAATGMDHIDLEAAKNHGVVVKNVVGYSTASVAQHTLSLALSYLHPVNKFVNYTRNDQWTKSNIFTHIINFEELQSKKWGIIGLGEIGKKVASIVSSFGADVFYYSTSGNNNSNEYTRIELDELLSSCDIVSIHCPFNEKTKNLIDLSKMKILKENALVINCGRGGIINEDDLFELLKSNATQTFALDVLSVEPMAEELSLRKYLGDKRLMLTPHVAWSSIQARNSLAKGIINNIQAFKSDMV